MLHDVEQFFDSDLPINKVVFVPAGLIPRIALQGLQNAFFLIQRHWIWMPLEIVVAGILTFITFLSNLLRSSLRGTEQPSLFESGIGYAKRDGAFGQGPRHRRTASAAESQSWSMAETVEPR